MDAVPVEERASTPFERRLRAEWSLLVELAARNPGRLTGLSSEDCTLRVTLCGTPARTLTGATVTEHPLRVVYPQFFPALPLEVYLEVPVFHPNVHPETGFVCVWERHRAAHTVEDAVHKTVAMLSWRLWNSRPEHTMQTKAAALTVESRAALVLELEAAPLLGVRGLEVCGPAETTSMRRRLS